MISFILDGSHLVCVERRIPWIGLRHRVWSREKKEMGDDRWRRKERKEA